MLKVTTCGALSAALLIAGACVAEAAGAIAKGKCGRYGYSYGYESDAGAEQRALDECSSNGDDTCKIVVNLDGNCGALAVDSQDSCTAQGWGYAQTRDEAERIARSYCRQYGGQDCRVVRWVCDGRG